MKLYAATIFTAIATGIVGFATSTPVAADDFRYGPDTCRNGFVWREASPTDRVCVTPASRATAARENALAYSRIDPAGAYGPFTCVSGFVWREAFHGDLVCVTPDRRAAVARENALSTAPRTRG
jgi:hypothetical protein